jgi:hypothetical protein
VITKGTIQVRLWVDVSQDPQGYQQAVAQVAALAAHQRVMGSTSTRPRPKDLNTTAARDTVCLPARWRQGSVANLLDETTRLNINYDNSSDVFNCQWWVAELATSTTRPVTALCRFRRVCPRLAPRPPRHRAASRGNQATVCASPAPGGTKRNERVCSETPRLGCR